VRDRTFPAGDYQAVPPHAENHWKPEGNFSERANPARGPGFLTPTIYTLPADWSPPFAIQPFSLPYRASLLCAGGLPSFQGSRFFL